MVGWLITRRLRRRRRNFDHDDHARVGVGLGRDAWFMIKAERSRPFSLLMNQTLLMCSMCYDRNKVAGQERDGAWPHPSGNGCNGFAPSIFLLFITVSVGTSREAS